jgi:hypothetical protein
MSQLNKTLNDYPKNMTGTVTLTVAPGTAWTVGNWIYVGTWATATFKAKVIKSSTTSTKVVVKQVTGTLASAASVKERVAGGGADGAATGTVATVNTGTVTGTNVQYTSGGWNLRQTDNGVVRSKIDGSRTKVEVLVASASYATIAGDFAVVATFTLTGGAWSAATTYDVSNGDAITLTVVSSEPVRVPAGATYAITVGATGRTATYLSSATDMLSHTFSYAVVSGDIGATTVSVAAGNFGGTGTFYEVADDGTQKAITAPVAVGGTLATKTGLTIQA